jgi:hypothetical protein
MSITAVMSSVDLYSESLNLKVVLGNPPNNMPFMEPYCFLMLRSFIGRS